VRTRDLLGNNALMMVAAFIVALLFGGVPEAYPRMNKDVAMIALMVMMSFALCNLKLGGLAPGAHARSVQRAFVLSFLLSTGTTIALAFLFTGEIRDGWILTAAVPSAVSVIPFVLVLGGDLEATLVSSAGLYLIALLFTPLLTLVFIGQVVSIITLLWYLGLLIAVPIAISRLLRRVDLDPGSGQIAINITFFVLVVAVAGSNRSVFFGEPVLLMALLAVAVVRTFGIGIALDAYNRRRGVPRGRRIPEVLFVTHKNTGMAAALAIALIGDAAAIPATVCMTVDIAWLIYVSRFMFPRSQMDGAETAAPS
jgi:bile acid:Na+ symporter, BASS family